MFFCLAKNPGRGVQEARLRVNHAYCAGLPIWYCVRGHKFCQVLRQNLASFSLLTAVAGFSERKYYKLRDGRAAELTAEVRWSLNRPVMNYREAWTTSIRD